MKGAKMQDAENPANDVIKISILPKLVCLQW
jgi:hypothetical protein